MIDMRVLGKEKLVILYRPELLIYSLAFLSFCLLMLFFSQSNKKHLFQDKQFYQTFLIDKSTMNKKNPKSNFMTKSNDLKQNYFHKSSFLLQVKNDSNDSVIQTANPKTESLNMNKPTQSEIRNMNKPTQPKAMNGIPIIINPEQIKTPENIKPLEKTIVQIKSPKPITDQAAKINLSKQFTQYKVIKGDCLWKIAKKFNVSIDMLVEYNNISDPDLIHIQKTIKIPV